MKWRRLGPPPLVEAHGLEECEAALRALAPGRTAQLNVKGGEVLEVARVAREVGAHIERMTIRKMSDYEVTAHRPL